MKKLTLILLVYLVTCDAKSVIKDKKKSQATIDKEVLLEDEDYDDDVLDLPPEEQKERLKNLATKKIDVNSDGYVDLSELQSWCVKAFDKFEKDELKEEFPVVDTNKDGSISWSEHVVDSFGEGYKEDDQRLVRPDTSDPDAVEHARNFRKEKRLFKIADKDQDTLLNLEEYFFFKHPRKYTETKLVLIEDKLEDSDLDKDRKISLKEYLKDEKAGEDEEENSEDHDDKFKELDEDGDGFLSDDEIVHWVDPSNKEEALEEAEHLLEQCDANDDSKLSLSEIINNHEIWVESDATDYGRHLMVNHDEF